MMDGIRFGDIVFAVIATIGSIVIARLAADTWIALRTDGHLFLTNVLIIGPVLCFVLLWKWLRGETH